MGRGGGKGKGGRGAKKSGGGGGKGKGKGTGARKRKRDQLDASDDEGAGGKGGKAGKGKKGKGKGKHKDDLEVKRRLVVEEPTKVKAARPSFDSLLKSFGVPDERPDSSDDENDEDDEEEPEEEGQAEADNKKAAKIMKVGQDNDDGPEADADDEEGEEEPQLDEEEVDGDEDEAEVASSGQAQVGGAGDDGVDFYARFWEDPPQPLDSTDAASSSTAPQKFELLGLSRCEAKRRDVSSLRAMLRSSDDAKSIWHRCGLSPGLKVAFDDYLSKKGIETQDEEGAFFLFLHAYLDVAFLQHTHQNGRAVRAAYMLHVVNHVLKASVEVLANTALVNKLWRKGHDDGGAGIQDKGFSRARVLILCPFRSTCYELVHLLMALCPSKKEIANKSRFESEFGVQEDADNEKKPADWRYCFDGNNDDSFRLGIAVSKKQMRLYSPFGSCDILICSPLGLRKITGAEGDRNREYDFLSSIEVCILDRADVLRMQNWEHVMEIMQVVNRRPQAMKDIDISRLRPAVADGRSRDFRQTIVTSAGQSFDSESVFFTGCTPLNLDGGAGKKGKPVNSLAQKFGLGKKTGGKKKRDVLDSDDEEEEDAVRHKLLGPTETTAVQGHRGLVKLSRAPEEGGPMQQATALGISRQFYLHVGCKTLQEQNDTLFDAFEHKYWTPLGSSLERLLIVVPTYLGFLRLRQYFRESGASFCSAFEYADSKDVARARFDFNKGERKVLLVTERFLWYRRFKLKGADYVLFYGPPETPEIYEEILSNTRTPSQCNCMCLFTKFDALALERLVGHQRMTKMLVSEPGKVFVYS